MPTFALTTVVLKSAAIEREPTTHLGPAATEMERRGEQTERGEMNRQAAEVNHEAAQTESLLAERDTLDKAIEAERERISSPPGQPGGRAGADARSR